MNGEIANTVGIRRINNAQNDLLNKITTNISRKSLALEGRNLNLSIENDLY